MDLLKLIAGYFAEIPGVPVGPRPTGDIVVMEKALHNHSDKAIQVDIEIQTKQQNTSDVGQDAEGWYNEI